MEIPKYWSRKVAVILTITVLGVKIKSTQKSQGGLREMAEVSINLKLDTDEARVICTALEAYLRLLGLRNTSKPIPQTLKEIADASEDVRVEAQKVTRLQGALIY